jgi:hypothetical protein
MIDKLIVVNIIYVQNNMADRIHTRRSQLV